MMSGIVRSLPISGSSMTMPYFFSTAATMRRPSSESTSSSSRLASTETWPGSSSAISATISTTSRVSLLSIVMIHAPRLGSREAQALSSGMTNQRIR